MRNFSTVISSVQFSSVAQSCPTLCDPMNSRTPGLPVPHQLPQSTQTHVHPVSEAMQPSHPLLFPSPQAPNPSQHQGVFQWVSSSHEVAKELEFQLQHQSFQWTPRTDLLYDGLLGSPCSSRDSQQSSPTPKFKSINFLALSFLHSPTHTSVHDHWKKHRCSTHFPWMILAPQLFLVKPFNVSSPHPKFHQGSGFVMPSPRKTKEPENGDRGLTEDVSSDATETPEHNVCPTQYYVLGVIKIMSFRKPSNYRKKEWRHWEE